MFYIAFQKWSTLLSRLCLSAAIVPLFWQTQAVARHHHVSSSPQPVALTAQPGTPLETTARFLNSDLLKDAAQHHDVPVVLIGTASLSGQKTDQALFVQIQSARLCGAAGCTTSVYRHRGASWDTILDSINGTISILPTRHRGMHDLLINHNDRWIWNGTDYQDTLGSEP